MYSVHVGGPFRQLCIMVCEFHFLIIHLMNEVGVPLLWVRVLP